MKGKQIEMKDYIKEYYNNYDEDGRLFKKNRLIYLRRIRRVWRLRRTVVKFI